MTTVVDAAVNTREAWSQRSQREMPWAAAGWSEHGQTQRFLAVLSRLGLRAGDTLLDFGCGTGRLCEFVPADVSYYAHDTAAGMLDRVRRDHARAVVLERLPERLFDHVVCVGPFNLADGWTVQRTWETLGELWAMSVRRTLTVSLYRGTDERCLRYSPVDVAVFVQQLGIRRFDLVASHLDNDLLLVAHR